MNNLIKENAGLMAILAIFIFSFYTSFNPNADLWWDSSVYIGMGKHIYSSGKAGLYEASRPLAWPLLLGFFWKVGLNPVIFGKLAVLLFGIGTILLTYNSAYCLFNKKIALLSSILLAFSPTFFLFNSILFTEIPSAFFSMLGILFFIRKKYSLMGLIFGIAFMARFFQIFLIIPFYLFLAYLVYKREAAPKQILASFLFFLIPIMPFLILSLILYSNPIYPFLLQAWMTKFTGWIFYQPFDFYLTGLIKENMLILFSLLGIFLLFKKEKGIKLMVPVAALLAFLPFNFQPHKEMRFIIFLLPIAYIISAYGMVKLSESFPKYDLIALFLILSIGILNVAPKLMLNSYEDSLDPFYKFMESKNIRQGLWISNPSFIAYTNAKADELIYYPLYNTEKISSMKGKIGKAKYVLINACDLLPCPPSENACMQEHKKFIQLLSENLKTELNEKRGNCEFYIFTS